MTPEVIDDIIVQPISVYPYVVFISNIDFDNESQRSAHEEMVNAYNVATKENWFQHNKNWAGRIRLSDPTFSRSILNEVPSDNFINYLTKCLQLYSIMIGYKDFENFILVDSWLTSSNKNEYSHAHAHGISHISGVYYVKTNGKDGNFYFQNPLRELESNPFFQHLTRNLIQKPEEGKLMMFPSSMLHGVEMNTTDNERVSLSFNIRIPLK